MKYELVTHARTEITAYRSKYFSRYTYAVPVRTGPTKALDIFENSEETIESFALSCGKIISLAMDGTDATCGKNTMVVGRLQNKLKEFKVERDILAVH